MSQSALTTELAAIREQLIELRRYTSNPSYVIAGVAGTVHRIRWACLDVGDGATYRTLQRLAANLEAGAATVLACPAALDGYLAGASCELLGLIERTKKGDWDAPSS